MCVCLRGLRLRLCRRRSLVSRLLFQTMDSDPSDVGGVSFVWSDIAACR